MNLSMDLHGEYIKWPTSSPRPAAKLTLHKSNWKITGNNGSLDLAFINQSELEESILQTNYSHNSGHMICSKEKCISEKCVGRAGGPARRGRLAKRGGSLREGRFAPASQPGPTKLGIVLS
ncbi:uncharacterized protein PGTG_07924 [Puccinia graminis f. sp. tritici CRL 75-36-700-3]|uniref:Uncharacterized protein n=1 Tax=Puccinia graminis f. sp. tritici (strain CRL 75-36-700-3 / race SCCL) TaxID=418459 RepID=E3KBG3_PUCGT|nr:uncharacterized protein PGTG_07924 [Puccinia graminis f. sp. tritici CRL 75-36-700-3]EFP81675.1 hypothetical protein PGTG_07924 [Puccinia graminis f. sp. tritici CRL 75-36-700-3]